MPVCGGFPCQDIVQCRRSQGHHGGNTLRLMDRIATAVCITDPGSCSWKTLTLLGRMDSGRRPAQFSEFSETWPIAGLMPGGTAFLRDSIADIAEIGCSLSPHPVCKGLPGNGEYRAAENGNVSAVDSATPGFLGKSPAPKFVRNLHGIHRRLDRIKALGNGVLSSRR